MGYIKKHDDLHGSRQVTVEKKEGPRLNDYPIVVTIVSGDGKRVLLNWKVTEGSRQWDHQTTLILQSTRIRYTNTNH